MNPFLYQPRSAVFHGVLEFDDQRLKIYRIASQEQAGVPLPERDRQRALLREALREDRWPTDHHIGFAIFHFANDGVYLLVSSWCDANMLRHRVFMISPQGRLEPPTKSSTMCRTIRRSGCSRPCSANRRGCMSGW